MLRVSGPLPTTKDNTALCEGCLLPARNPSTSGAEAVPGTSSVKMMSAGGGGGGGVSTKPSDPYYPSPGPSCPITCVTLTPRGRRPCRACSRSSMIGLTE